MRHVNDIVNGFDITKPIGRKKARLVEWFQARPGSRFDVAEVYASLGGELDVGEGQIRNYLNSLADDGVLQRHGEKRIAYELADDVVVPMRYQAFAVLRHLGAIFDIKRWGLAGFLTIMTAIWAALTLPFWFMWGTLVVYPMDSYASITRPEFLQMAISMTVWLVVFIFVSTALYRLRRGIERGSRQRCGEFRDNGDTDNLPGVIHTVLLFSLTTRLDFAPPPSRHRIKTVQSPCGLTSTLIASRSSIAR